MENRYPKLEINLAHLRHNVATIVENCGKYGVQVAGVIKGASGLPQISKAFADGGAAMIASSRLEQLEDAKNIGVDKPMMLIRVPMLSEISEVIRVSDISFNSELETIEALNQEARKQGKLHKVILMADVGDLREGYWDKEEIVDVAERIENKMINIQLAGVGMNVGCYGSVLPTVDKLEELAEIAEKIEERIGRELEYVSGGATSSYMRILDGNMPKKINHLRIGEAALLALDLDRFFGYDVSDMYQDVFRLRAQVIEVKNKPTHPVGTLAVDAFGHTPVYVDRGIRRRALLGMGKIDYGFYEELLPAEEGIEIVGAASDHTIVDVEDAVRDFKIGDIMTFDVCYANMVYLTNNRNVHLEFIDK